MKQIAFRYATPLITGLFVVSLVSGLALYFGVARPAFHEMHEILSLVLIAPFALHLWRNWRQFGAYFRKTPMAVALALSLVAAAAFAWPSLTGAGPAGRGGPPQVAVAQMMSAQPLSAVAPALGLAPQEAAARLQAAGFAPTQDASIAEMAQAAGRSTNAALAALAGR
ncbi:DUF4405 domain-containing protein [Albimonas sp. CAU 1670]|uniref:DUF4405 domain-containing protein n=1 Tax=Albimonas sp. CAU 1670 TaxID=3032599 RepID=UPI0023D9F0A5|nr:DUF4405 domain-containing protein [Albimonas sp. CAU 1670]MDF2231214.1 DUF4405 domain-containing protein [Albimonas sp. CAU 1670]